MLERRMGKNTESNYFMLLLLKVVLHIAESWGETKIAVKTFLFIYCNCLLNMIYIPFFPIGIAFH